MPRDEQEAEELFANELQARLEDVCEDEIRDSAPWLDTWLSSFMQTNAARWIMRDAIRCQLLNKRSETHDTLNQACHEAMTDARTFRIESMSQAEIDEIRADLIEDMAE